MAGWPSWDSDMHQGRKDTMLMDTKTCNNSISMRFLQTITGLWTRDAQMGSDTSRGSSFHGREGWGTKRGSGYMDGNILEYHIDSVDPHKLKETPLWGNLSIRFPRGAKPLVIFGHDDCMHIQTIHHVRKTVVWTQQRNLHCPQGWWNGKCDIYRLWIDFPLDLTFYSAYVKKVIDYSNILTCWW